MKKWIVKTLLSRVWKPKSISVPAIRGRALAIRDAINSLLEKADDGVLDAGEQAAIVEEMLNALL